MPHGAIHPAFHEYIRRIQFRLDIWPNRAKRVKPLGSGKLHIGFLQIAGGDVIHARVTAKIRQRVVGIQKMRSPAANDKSQLPFVLHLVRILWKDDRLPRSNY